MFVGVGLVALVLKVRRLRLLKSFHSRVDVVGVVGFVTARPLFGTRQLHHFSVLVEFYLRHPSESLWHHIVLHFLKLLQSFDKPLEFLFIGL